MSTTVPRLAAEARWRPAAGTDACGNPGNLVQIRARLRDVIVLINRRRQTMSLVAHTSELQQLLGDNSNRTPQ